MRAWVVHRHGAPHEALRQVEIDAPVPGPGEVLLRVSAAAVGMPDVFLCRGTYAFRPALPFVPGQEVSGTVEAVGEGVDLPLGTRCMGVTSFFDGRGGFAEHTVARADSLFRVPDGMEDVDAAGFRIGFSTAWIGLVRRGGLVAGDRLLVLGAAGGSGAAAVRLGAALGARVLAVAAGTEKLALCGRLGAEVLVDRAAGSVEELVASATDGAGVDLVYDPVGGEAAAAAARCLARGGRLLAVGFASGRWAELDPRDLVRRNLSLVGVYAGGYTRAENEQDHDALLARLAPGGFGGCATGVAFDELPDALASVEAGTAVGKLVVRMGDR